MTLQHSEEILAVTRAFLHARLPSEFALVTTGSIQKLEALTSVFDSEYLSVEKEVEIHNLALEIEQDRASVNVKVTFRYTNPETGGDWSHESDGVVHLRRESAGWRVSDFVDNRRSQCSGIFLEPFGGHEFQGVEIAPLAAELSHGGLLLVLQVVNRTTEPLELVFSRLHYKSCRVLARVLKRSQVAPPGVTTTTLAIFPIALPVETPKFRLELGILGVRSNTGYNVALDVGLNSAELDAPKAKRRRGRRTNLPFSARFGLGAASLAAFFGSLTLLPDAAPPPAPPERSKEIPTEAVAVSDTFVDALKGHDTAGALELLDPYTPQRRKLVRSLTAAVGRNLSAELGPPRGVFYPVGGANRLPSAEINYALMGNPCPSGQPERLGELDTSLSKSKGLWTLYWASYRDDRTPCS
jgi:hypothetical protein